MASPIKPQPRTGPAGAYDEAVKERKRKAAEWLGLPLDKVLSITLSRGPYDVYEIGYRSNGRLEPARGLVTLRNRSSTDEWKDASGGFHYTEVTNVQLGVDETMALDEHLGPMPEPPQFVSLWDARAGDLKPGMKLYDEQGNVVGEVGDSVRGTARGVAFGIFDG